MDLVSQHQIGDDLLDRLWTVVRTLHGARLAHRLATYWLPVVPGWAAFQLLQRRNLI